MFNKWPKKGALLLIGDLKENHDRAYQYARSLLHREVLLNSQAHPDFKLIEPNLEAQSKIIKIDQIRELVTWSIGTPQIAAQKIAIIYPAHAMNVQAANALLKTLEEPLGDVLIILITDRPSLLPATIRSRCYKIRYEEASIFNSPPTYIEQDLKILRSQKEDPITVASRWVKEDPKELLYWVLVVFYNTLKTKALKGSIINNQEYWNFLDRVYESRKMLESSQSPNVQLLLETLLIDYTTITIARA